QDRRRQLLGSAVAEMAAEQGDPSARLLDSALERHPHAGWMSLVSYAEARTYMHDVLLRDTDQMSMRHGLEVRVPLLDHRLVEYVMGLSDNAKHAEGAPKQLLVEAVGDPVLPEVAARPKRGFVMPFDLWMRGELRGFCEAHLGPEAIAQQQLLRPEAVQWVWRSFLAGNGETWSRPWALVALNAWMKATGVAA
ncbi:MAG: asparagine synthase-related protein, partial [Vicinamibacterales bacterium]